MVQVTGVTHERPLCSSTHTVHANTWRPHMKPLNVAQVIVKPSPAGRPMLPDVRCPGDMHTSNSPRVIYGFNYHPPEIRYLADHLRQIGFGLGLPPWDLTSRVRAEKGLLFRSTPCNIVIHGDGLAVSENQAYIGYYGGVQDSPGDV